MIERFRELDSSLIITGAPQCPTSDAWFDMKEMIQTAAFDALFVQFYNNPICDALHHKTSEGGFNFHEWEEVLANSDKNQNTKLYIGLPASPAAAGSGYLEPCELKELVCEYEKSRHFGGISLWDLTRGAANLIDGKDYNEHVLDILAEGCVEVDPTTPTTTPDAPPKTPITTPDAPTKSPTTTPAAPTKSPYPSPPKITSGYNTKTWSNNTITTGSQSQTTSGQGQTTSAQSTITSSQSMTTSTVYTTTVYTVTSCPAYVDCPHGGYVTTEIVPIYTTVCPITATDDVGHGSRPTGVPGYPIEHPNKPGHPEKPGHPGKPGHQGEPEHPDKPGHPGTPSHPSEPEHPSEPGQPGEPGRPTDAPCQGEHCPEPTETTIWTTVTKSDSTVVVPIPTGGWTHTPAPDTPDAPISGAVGLTIGTMALLAAIALHVLVF